MSIHRALGELKTYDDRITKASELQFVIANKKSNEKIAGKTIEEFKSHVKGGFASYYALTENQKRLKAAVVLSNATTKVKIGGVEYSVAEAIERKAKIHHDISFLNKLKSQFNIQNKRVEEANDALPEKLESYLQSILGDKDKRTVEDIAAHTKAFEERNKYELLDPCNITMQIEKLEESITSFKTEVDYILSESNAVTFIDVDFVD